MGVYFAAAPAQPAAFQNLGFESATLVQVSDFQVLFGPAFPGWNGFVGGIQQTQALYNTIYLNTSGISILDNTSPYGLIEGGHTAVVQAGDLFGTGDPADATLRQTGFVPVGVHSLLFKARAFGDFSVTLGGEGLQLTTLGTGVNYTLYGANISRWAAHNAELDFTVFPQQPDVHDNYLFLDSIEFSTDVVPEPTVAELCAVGGLLIGLIAWLKGRNNGSGRSRGGVVFGGRER
jgi:hypothetical protein